MAVFLINICKFNGCGITFPSLGDLIQHIEDTHIDYDSQIIGQKEKSQSTCLPLSYVLRFITDPSRKENSLTNGTAGTGIGGGIKGTSHSGIGGGGDGTGYQSTPPGTPSSNASLGNGVHALTGSGGYSVGTGNGTSGGTNSSGGADGKLTTGSAGTDMKRKIAIKHHSYSMSSSNRSTTPTGSEMDDDDMMVSESEDSNDSWTTEEFSSEFIMRYGSRRHSSSGGNGLNSSNEKPFACPVPGCKKRYKNVNGIKYHSKNGHKKDGNRVRKGFKCHCGKSYKTSQRLKNHQLSMHQNPVVETLQTSAVTASVVPQLSTSALLSSSSTLSSSSSSCSSTVSSIVASVCSSANNSSSNNSNTSGSVALAVPGTAVATAAVSSQIASSSSSTSSSSTSSSAGSPNGKYDNLGILTPATSPKLTLVSTTTTASESILPMTPISPNASTTTATVTGSSNNSITSTNTGTASGGGGGGGGTGSTNSTMVSSKNSAVISAATLVSQLHTEET